MAIALRSRYERGLPSTEISNRAPNGFIVMADRDGAGLLVCHRSDTDTRFEAEFDESTHRFRARDALLRRPLTNSGLRVFGQSQREDGPIPAA